jgi:hypothetical protein
VGVPRRRSIDCGGQDSSKTKVFHLGSYGRHLDCRSPGGKRTFKCRYWSLANPFLLGLVLKVFRPSPFHHSLAVHLLAVLSLVVALVSFEYRLSVFFEYREQFSEEPFEAGGEAVSDDAVWLVGYSLFFWITIFLTPAYLEESPALRSNSYREREHRVAR